MHVKLDSLAWAQVLKDWTWVIIILVYKRKEGKMSKNYLRINVARDADDTWKKGWIKRGKSLLQQQMKDTAWQDIIMDKMS